MGFRDRLVDPQSPGRRPRRAAYALPTLFTAGNIFLGYIAILRAIRGAMLAASNAGGVPGDYVPPPRSGPVFAGGRGGIGGDVLAKPVFNVTPDPAR